MTDVATLPDGSPAQASDKIMLLRGGVPYSVTITELLSATFAAALSLAEAVVVGRASNSSGSPQALTLGPGIAVAGTELLASAEDHLGLELLSQIDINAELIVNSAGQPARLELLKVLSYLAANIGGGALPGLTLVSAAPNAEIGVLPAGAYLLSAFFHEIAGNAATVGIGTTAGAQDVVVQKSVSVNGTLTVPTDEFSRNWFSASMPQPLYLTGSFVSVSVDLIYRIGP